MRRYLLLLPLILLSACAGERVADLNCSDVSDEAIELSNGRIVAINGTHETHRVEGRLTCHGTGMFSNGNETPVRFEAVDTDDGDVYFKWDTDEAQAAAEARAAQAADMAEADAERQMRRDAQQAAAGLE